LHLRESEERPLLASLFDFLQPRQLLLILDNCEHLIDGAARLVTPLLRDCPQLQILATSREVLAVPGEKIYRVQPLALPPGLLGGRPSRAAVEKFDAIRLFVERARTVWHTFALADQNAPGVVRLCQRLDGIPLAIELAAAWNNLLTPEQIADRLETNFDLLASGTHALLPRHQTLNAAIDWSYTLLSAKEQVLLRRLSVFAGGWFVDGAEDVAGELPPLVRSEILALLQRLVNKSLVVVEHFAEGTVRFRLLETIREYAHRKLVAAREEETVRDRHLAYFVEMAQQTERESQTQAQQNWRPALDQEQENLRTALDWTHRRQMAEQELRLTVALGLFWKERGHYAEGRRRLTAALERNPEASPLRAQALLWAGMLARLQGDMAEACPLCEESLLLFRHWNDRPGEAQSLENLGWIRSNENREEATGYFQESLAIYRGQNSSDDCSRLLTTLAQMAREEQDFDLAQTYLTQALESGGLGTNTPILNGLAELASLSGDYEEAARLLTLGLASIDRAGSKQEWAWSYAGLAENCWHRGTSDEGLPYAEKSVSFFRELGSSSGLAIALHHLGLLWLALDRPEMAADALGESLHLCQTNCMHFMAARCLAGLAGVALAEGDGLRAARLLDAADPQLTRQHQLLTPADHSFYSRLREDSRARLGQAVGHAL
ncbi:MAG: tetratricopeptide repeat protein, partial [Caldilineaceae bacterium]